jgi:hypothetical protein
MTNPTLDADQPKLAQKLVDKIRRKVLEPSGEEYADWRPTHVTTNAASYVGTALRAFAHPTR